MSRSAALGLRAAGALLLAGLAGALILGAVGGDVSAHAAGAGLPCPFHALTGVVCPLCGMTHATLALGAGDLGAAFAAHPLFPVVLGFTAWGGWHLWRGRPLTVAGRPVEVAHILAGVAVVWIANLISQFA